MTNPSLRGLATQLERMTESAAFVKDGYVRVVDPEYLIKSIREAADAIDRAAPPELAGKTLRITNLTTQAFIRCPAELAMTQLALFLSVDDEVKVEVER